MRDLFSQVLNMSLTGSVVILLVMLARLFLKRSPKVFSYALWSVVLFRLLCPVALSAPVSVLDVFQPEVQETSQAISVVSYLPAETRPTVDAAFVPAESRAGTDTIAAEERSRESLDLMTVASHFWITGVAAMLLYSAAQYILLRIRLIGAMAYRKNVYLADHIDTPFVMGFLRPRIYLPSDVPTKERRFILAHERHHIRRLDHVVKLLAYAALSLHWFNPLVWSAFILAGKDMEMSCDEAVIRKLGSQIRAEYSAALLRLATHRKIIAGAPLAFGEGDTKGRVMNMARWKKPRLWACMICLLLCLAVLAACAVNPEGKQDNLEEMTRTTGPASVGVGELHFTLPEGYSIEVVEPGIESSSKYPHYDSIIRKDGEIAGGVYILDKPKFSIDAGQHNVWDWVEALNVPENVPEERFMMWVSAGIEGPASAAYGKKGIEETVHYFYVGKAYVFDLWIDQSQFDEETEQAILDSARLEEEATDPAESIFLDTVQIGQLPEGYDHQMYTNDILFLRGTETVGGVTFYPIPEGVYDPADEFFLWLEEVGIPDFEDETLCYMGGMTAWDNGWLAEFATDVPEGVEKTVDRRHHFYPVGDVVYDIWFDMLKIDYAVSEDIRIAVSLPIEEAQETADSEVQSAEDAAFALCEGVFDAIQSGSYHLVSEMSGSGTAVPDGYPRIYCSHDGDKLCICTVRSDINDPERNRQGYLSVGDRFYSSIGTEEETGYLIWEESEPPENFSGPWLDSFYWTKNAVSYIDTLTDDDGQCVMYRIDRKYEDRDDYADCYWANFYFDPNGRFLNVALQVNLFQDNEFTIKESIVTLDPEVVSGEIQWEYQRAIG